jgi:hypothetical protein
MTTWEILAGPFNTGPAVVLANARNRSMTFKVDDSASLQFSLDGHDDAFAYITELQTDVWVLRDGVVFFRGRVGPTQDTITTEDHTVTVNVFDYREWLGRQVLASDAPLTWRGKTKTQIITDMLTYLNGQSGIKPTITLDNTKLDTNLTDFDVLVGTTIRDAVALMVGFGWQVIPTSMTALSLKAVSPFYYRLNSYFVMEYGGAVMGINRSLNTASYANEVFVTGDMSLTPVFSQSTDIATNPRGPLAVVLSDPSIVGSNALSSAAAADLQNYNVVAADWSVDLAPGAWINETDAWLGDICRFVARSGRLNVNDQYRITEMTVNLNDDGSGHQVSCALVRPPFVPSS